jgi:hypothetical protein
MPQLMLFQEKAERCRKKRPAAFRKTARRICAPAQTISEITVKKTYFYFKYHCKYKRFEIPLRGENTKQYIVFY